jgi:hypothetical protein
LTLGDSGEGEGLAGEAGGEDVVLGDGGDAELADIGVGRVAVPGLVGFLGEFVPFAGEKAFAAEFFEGAAEATDAGEQVDEGEGQISSLLDWPPMHADKNENTGMRTARVRRSIPTAPSTAAGWYSPRNGFSRAASSGKPHERSNGGGWAHS